MAARHQMPPGCSAAAEAAGRCVCCAGDCPHCLATVDGVGYLRTCQVRAASAMQLRAIPMSQAGAEECSGR